MKTIHFEDHGQDFLEWDIDADGNVLACRPFQGSLWCRCLVLNPDLANGDYVQIRNPWGETSNINYPAVRVIDHDTTTSDES